MPLRTNNKQKLKKTKAHSCSSSDSENSEHELLYYASDKIRLMKEVLKLIKPKKIKSIAPDFMKHLDIEEINSMLLEELLGISNKRLKRILNGEFLEDESSSTDSDEENQTKPIDVISLDDISDSDDEFGLGCVNDNKKNYEKNKKDKHKKVKVPKPIKQEKLDKTQKVEKSKKSNKTSDKANSESEKEKLMSVLEILELQARARAIRSQLALENTNKKATDPSVSKHVKQEEVSDDSDAVVIEHPQNEEIVISSSESENDEEAFSKQKKTASVQNNVLATTSERVKTKRKHMPNDVVFSGKGQVESQKEHNPESKKCTDNVECTGNIKVTTIIDGNEKRSEPGDKFDKNYTQNKSKSLVEKSDSENDEVINLDTEDMEND